MWMWRACLVSACVCVQVYLWTCSTSPRTRREKTTPTSGRCCWKLFYWYDASIEHTHTHTLVFFMPNSRSLAADGDPGRPRHADPQEGLSHHERVPRLGEGRPGLGRLWEAGPRTRDSAVTSPNTLFYHDSIIHMIITTISRKRPAGWNKEKNFHFGQTWIQMQSNI